MPARIASPLPVRPGITGDTYNNSGFSAISFTTPGCTMRLADNDQMAAKRTLSIKPSAAKKDAGAELQRVRRICFSIPGIVEKISHGAPTFFTPKRVFTIFVNNHHNDGHVAVWVPAAPGVQAALIEEARDTYFRPPYVGVSGWVGVELSKVD